MEVCTWLDDPNLEFRSSVIWPINKDNKSVITLLLQRTLFQINMWDFVLERTNSAIVYLSSEMHTYSNVDVLHMSKP